MQYERGEKPSDVLARDRMSPIDRSMLAQAVHEIAAVQRRMDNVAVYLPADAWTIAGADVTEARRGRVAVVGDVGGHRRELRAELLRLGADPHTGRLPADLTVVQVGDLVHRGPDSEGVIGLVDGYLRHQPDQWVQLVGNHEAQYLRDPAFAWRQRLDAATADILRRWWADGRMRVAAAITGHGRGDGDDILVTHAGLTAAFWREDLGAPEQVSGPRRRRSTPSRTAATTCCSDPARCSAADGRSRARARSGRARAASSWRRGWASRCRSPDPRPLLGVRRRHPGATPSSRSPPSTRTPATRLDARRRPDHRHRPRARSPTAAGVAGVAEARRAGRLSGACGANVSAERSLRSEPRLLSGACGANVSAERSLRSERQR